MLDIGDNNDLELKSYVYFFVFFVKLFKCILQYECDKCAKGPPPFVTLGVTASRQLVVFAISNLIASSVVYDVLLHNYY